MSQRSPKSYSVFVSNAIDGDISVFHLDTASGRIDLTDRYAAAETVMPLAVSNDQQLLYAAIRGTSPAIATYDVDPHTGRLSHRRSVPIASSLAYLSIDPSGRYLLGASYGEHCLNLYSVDRLADVDANGTPVQVVPGIENAHAVIVSPDNRFAYVSSLGANKVYCYEIQSGAAGDKLAFVDDAKLGDGFGPRHLHLSTDGKRLYVLSEFRATVAVFPRDIDSGRLGALKMSGRPVALAHLEDGRIRPTAGTVQPDPRTLTSLVWAADIHVTPDDRFVYVSERTSSRLIAYRVQADGSLEYASSIDTELQPRGFNIDPSGRFLVACGEK
ncbi:lactonase family protein, partial [Caballeronia sp.]|uniref:lactonase family protein n=1 Tax=Caballeronia sp. TaxID=1931223 RepID=UPI003C671260